MGLKVSVIYHSKIAKKERARRLGVFESEKTEQDILVVVNSLREGYDFPPISVVGIFCNIASAVKFDQFVGRGVRIVRDEDGNRRDQGVSCDVVYSSLYDYRLPEQFRSCESETLVDAVEREANQAREDTYVGDED
mmetsp:Transcript_18960/g.29743  ORF Transcript_18960/g.29743 Transcript_18960/m.29743 type:complete len:136 (-) Transcript_18960:113-520(-)